MVEDRGRRIAAGLERFLWVAAVALTLAACSDDDPAGPGASPPVAVVEVNPDDVVLAPGDTVTLTATLLATDGSEITGRPVTWLSSAPQFATVATSGRVTAVAAGGPVLITATSEGKTGPAFVIVAAPTEGPQLVQLDPATVAAGSGPVSITVLGQGFAEDAEARWNGGARPTTWLAGGVLEIELTAADVAQPGQGEIRVYNPGPGSGLSAPLHLPIVPAGVATVELLPFATEIDAGQALPLAARGWDASGRLVEGRPVEWTTGDEAIASVTPSGVLMGHRGGKTSVRAEIDGRFGEVEVTVRPGLEPVAYVFVEPYDLVTLVGRITPASTRVLSTSGAVITGRPVIWSSQDPSIATIDGEGRISARSKGTTWIHATVGGREGMARVEVRQYPTSPVHAYELRLDPMVLLNAVGDTMWVVDGVTRPATLHLTAGVFEVDARTDTYRLTWTLRVAVPGAGWVATTTRVESGSARRYYRGPLDYGYTISPAESAPFEAPAGPGDLTMHRSLGGIAPYPFHFVIV